MMAAIQSDIGPVRPVSAVFFPLATANYGGPIFRYKAVCICKARSEIKNRDKFFKLHEKGPSLK
jgi:hypothetical protein